MTITIIDRLKVFRLRPESGHKLTAYEDEVLGRAVSTIKDLAGRLHTEFEERLERLDPEHYVNHGEIESLTRQLEELRRLI